jgi:hypothetical protein
MLPRSPPLTYIFTHILYVQAFCYTLWECRSLNKSFLPQACKLALDHVDHVHLEHIPREMNSKADALANYAVDHQAWRLSVC